MDVARIGSQNGHKVQLVYGGGRLDRIVDRAEELLLGFRRDTGTDYLKYAAVTSPDTLVPEDLAVTVLINSRFDMRAFLSIQRNGAT
jgi:hypothetical protein